MKSVLYFGVLLLTTPVIAAQYTLRVVDTDGKPVDTFQVMWFSGSTNSTWRNARNGEWKETLKEQGEAVNVIVRADGFASKLQHFQNESLRELLNGDARITLSPGREVDIQLEFSDGISVPHDFRLQGYIAPFKRKAYSKWQPNDLRGNTAEFTDFNMLYVRRVGDGAFSLRLPPEGVEFYLAIQHPGWLQFCELGPFGEDDVVDGVLSVVIPEPATIEIIFDDGSDTSASLPFDEATCMVYWKPFESGSIYRVIEDNVRINPGSPITLTDLGPGRYLVRVRTKAKGDITKIVRPEINPRRFSAREYVVLSSGAVKSVDFSWQPFDPDAYRGDARARISILNPGGDAPVGKTAKITWYDGHYGQLTVHEGEIPADGIIALDGISGKRHRGASPFGPYTVAVDDERLGFFTLEDTAEAQDFDFTITPGIGDVAPDIPLIDVESHEVSRLSDYRGNVVFLEFWSIGCGPCQPAMQKLNDLAAQRSQEWHEKVAILSLSTDSDPNLVRDHAANRGWTAMPHFIGKRDDGAHFSEAETAYVILGIPEAVLIDQSGNIAWRGHPLYSPDGESVADRIASLLK